MKTAFLVAMLLLIGQSGFSQPVPSASSVTVLGPGKSGSDPATPLLVDGDGNVFGNTVYGGKWGQGTLYELSAGTRRLRVLADFRGRDGARPNAGLIRDAHGNLFGTTFAGGASAGRTLIGSVGNDGVIFELPHTPTGYGRPVVLASFSHRTGDFVTDGLVADAQGDLFGVTQFGGRHNKGTAFELPAGSHRIKVLAAFNGKNGLHPGGNGSGLILDRQGNLFGSTEQGGAGYDGSALSGGGVLYELPAAGRRMTILARFHGRDGLWPENGLALDAQGDLFGATSLGGEADRGTVFELPAGKRHVSVLASFHEADGAFPNGPLLRDASGSLFGTTTRGGRDNNGTLFEVPFDGRRFQPLRLLARFDGRNGNMPHGALLRDKQGNLFGTAFGGGSSGKGTVFELPAGHHQIVCLASFRGRDGDMPLAGLVWSGGLVGATFVGGNGSTKSAMSGQGVIFSVRPQVGVN